MSEEPMPTAAGASPSAATAQQPPGLEVGLLWVAGTTLAALSIGSAAGFLQLHGVAPVGLAPLAVGFAVGCSLVGLGRLFGLTIRRRWLAAAVGWALLAVAAEDYIGFWGYVRSREAFEQRHPQAALFSADARSFGPADFWRFVRQRVIDSPLLWSADLVLTAAAAAAWTEIRRRASIAPGQPSK